MPLTVQDGTILGAGMWCAALSTYYYKRRQTLPFKAAYFAAWPLLGTAIIWIGMPSRKNMEKELKEHGIETEASLNEAHRRSQLQMQALKEAAGKS